MDDHQASYSTQRRDVIVKRVDDELDHTEAKKRPPEATEEYTETSKRPKLTEIDLTATGFEHATARSVDDRLNIGELTTRWTEAEGEFAAFETMSNLTAFNAPVTAFNAPVHDQINWLAFIPQAEI